MKKNGDANNNPIFMFVIAVVFIGGGILSMVVQMEDKPVWVTILGVVLVIFGALILVWAIYRSIQISKYNQLMKDTTAYITDATFVSAKLSSFSSTSVGTGMVQVPVKANVYKKVKYSYTDETGAARQATSINSFTPNQVSFLQQKGTFKIKCKGAVSAIIEEIPAQNSNFNL